MEHSLSSATPRRWVRTVAVLACMAFLVSSGCITKGCCKADKCRQEVSCAEPYVRTITIVDDRVTGCPNTWTVQAKMTKNDVLEIINCSSEEAKLDFAPATFFNEGGTHQVPVGSSLRLTVSDDVPADGFVSFTIFGEGDCSHPGSNVIIQGGP